jgi:glycosyltransferase involved in cell wall biosynthesis
LKALVVHPRVAILGGAERVLLHFLNALRRDFSVTLCSEKLNEDAFADFFGVDGGFWNGIRRISYPPFEPRFPRLSVYQRIAHQRLFELEGLTRFADSFDVVFSTQDIMYMPKTSIPSLQYCTYPNYFSSLENQRHLQGKALGANSNDRTVFWRIYYLPAEREFSNRASRAKVISLSNYTRAAVKRAWGVGSEIVYPPCPVDYYQPMDKENLVVTVGRMDPAKRFEIFFQIAKLVPNYRFVVVSSISRNDGWQYYDWILRSKPENAEVILKPLRHCPELLGKARFYVHCMIGEHFGITTVEAMSAACVPVVHNSGGQPEIIHDSGIVWNTPEEAASFIKNTSKHSADQLSKRAVQISKQYRPEIFEDKIERIARDMVRDRYPHSSRPFTQN